MSAVISSDEKYRYLLTREFGSGLGTCTFIMLNPSTADAEHDDPTIRKCTGFARRLGCSKLHVVNLFAFRATDPNMLYGKPETVLTSGRNDAYINSACRAASLIICAWGRHGELYNSGERQQNRLIADGFKLHALKLLHGGEPGHPLYLKNDTPLLRLNAR